MAAPLWRFGWAIECRSISISFLQNLFELAELEKSLPFFAQAEVLQRGPNTLTFTVQRARPIKLSFFGGLSFGRIGEPERTTDGILSVASLLDLAGTKAAVVQVRAEAKDYRDVLALMRAGVPLATLLAAGKALYREQFNPLITLKALSYFGDGDLGILSAHDKSGLISAVHAVGELPNIERIASRISLP